MRWYFLLTSALIIFDQLSKFLAREYLIVGQDPVSVIPGFFEFTLVYNTGIAFGLLEGVGVWLTPFAVFVAVLAAFGYAKSDPERRLFRASMVLLTAGAIGNMIDRLFRDGRVTDFIDMPLIHVFNVADSCITIAAVLLGIHWLLDIRQEAANRSTPEETVAEIPEDQAGV